MENKDEWDEELEDIANKFAYNIKKYLDRHCFSIGLKPKSNVACMQQNDTACSLIIRYNYLLNKPESCEYFKNFEIIYINIYQ